MTVSSMGINGVAVVLTLFLNSALDPARILVPRREYCTSCLGLDSGVLCCCLETLCHALNVCVPKLIC